MSSAVISRNWFIALGNTNENVANALISQGLNLSTRFRSR